MSMPVAETDLTARVRSAFAEAHVPVASVDIRQFPGETVVVVEVGENFDAALQVANKLDQEIPNGFVTVRKVSPPPPTRESPITSLADPRITTLIELLNARSRTSERQPSLNYAEDAAGHLSVTLTRRNHLVFGRRGVGKTALMLEAKRIIEERGATTFWLNLQSMRALPAYAAFLTTASRIIELPRVVHVGRQKLPRSVDLADQLKTDVKQVLSTPVINTATVDLLVPRVNEMLSVLSSETQNDLYLFLDDIHYLGMQEQPRYLDMIHSISRDALVWIKAAGIKHQTRWFTDNPPTGLQTNHDAAIINLDITLEDPAKAKKFLTNILKAYVEDAGIESASQFMNRDALDRLVLASGGVPRDFLLLCASAIQIARQRQNARALGVQDVNEAAGRATSVKIQELEDDAASSVGTSRSSRAALNVIQQFLLEEQKTTYFRIDFKDKEDHSNEYNAIQSLMDLRLIHLLNASISDERIAGHRSEVYMLDLSQFSGTRFKRNLRVIDFERKNLVVKNTGTTDPAKKGDTPNRLLGILRRGPLFDLSRLTNIGDDTAASR